VVAVVLVLAVVVLAAPPVAAKEFRIAAVQVEARLQPDGSMQVVEHLTYDFSGEFHNGTRPIPPGDYGIVDVQVTEAGRPLPFRGAPYDLAWSYDARDERRTFDISYTVLGAAKVGPDVAELYWKFVGDQHPGVGEVRVALDVPGDGLDVRAWGHGPLDGLVEIQGTRVLLTAPDLPPGRFVEARVTLPSNAFTVAPSGDARLPRVLAEETRLADEANAERERDAAASRRRRLVLDVLERVYWLFPVAGWAVFALLWTRYGREHRAPVDVGEYVREPPDDPPAVVPMLFAWGSVPPVALSATIVDLAQRGHLTIEELRKDRWILPDAIDWKLTRSASEDALRPFEHEVLERLFEEGAETTQSEFEDWCKRHRTSADRWWRSVQQKLKTELRERRYIEGGKFGVYAGNVLAAGAVAASGAVVVSQGIVAGAVGIGSGVVQLVATILLRRRTVAGAQRLAEWRAFRRFLEDFSELEEAPVGHLILWERYLVYAVALGVTAQVARALAAKIPAEASSATTFAPWFHGSHGPGALDSIGSLSGFANGFGPTIVAAAHPPSSSSSGSGGGGGFSGGGGGGGGGGGIGAS
jgi:uncharacterized membrane protein